MLETTKLPKVLWEFIHSVQHRLLEETDAEYVDYAVELVWLDRIYPMYTNITFYVIRPGNSDRVWGAKLQRELNDTKPESLFEFVPAPFIKVEFC